MKNVMTRAWEIAREGVKKFGGKVKEYFAQALRLAWAETKKGVKKMDSKELYRVIKKAADDEAKKVFAEYMESMKAKGVKISNANATSATMTAPNGTVVEAYAHSSQNGWSNGIAKFNCSIRIFNNKVEKLISNKELVYKETDYLN